MSNLLPFEDPASYGNSAEHRSGRVCIEKGCTEPAGTLWSPLWCVAHNIERIRRINARLDEFDRRPHTP